MTELLLTCGTKTLEDVTISYAVLWPPATTRPKVSSSAARAGCAGYGLVVHSTAAHNPEDPIAQAIMRAGEIAAHRGFSGPHRVTDRPDLQAATEVLATDALQQLYTLHAKRAPASTS